MDMTLPMIAMVRSPEGEPIMVKRGERGYWPAPAGVDPVAWCEVRGINAAQAEAMLVGSMFGWDVPGAYAANCGYALAPIEPPCTVDQGRMPCDRSPCECVAMVGGAS